MAWSNAIEKRGNPSMVAYMDIARDQFRFADANSSLKSDILIMNRNHVRLEAQTNIVIQEVSRMRSRRQCVLRLDLNIGIAAIATKVRSIGNGPSRVGMGIALACNVRTKKLMLSNVE